MLVTILFRGLCDECVATERTKAEATSQSEACALASAAAAANVGHVTPCDVINMTSSSSSSLSADSGGGDGAAEDERRSSIPFVSCGSPPFAAPKPSLAGQTPTDNAHSTSTRSSGSSMSGCC